MTNIEIISLSASIASLVLAIVAIALSIVFYILSTKVSQETTKAANDISLSVQKLEKIFDTLYNDTFTMMKDTVSTIQKHAWGDESMKPGNLTQEIESNINTKLNEIKSSINNDLIAILNRQNINEDQINTIKDKVNEYLNNVINETREVENTVISESIRARISNWIFNRKNGDIFYFGDLCKDFFDVVSIQDIAKEIFKMRSEGLVNFKGQYLEESSVILVSGKLKKINNE